MSSGDFSTSWLILLVSSASTIPAEACHSALIAKGKTHAMFDMESFAFESHLLGGAERLAVPSAKALDKLERCKLFCIGCSVLAGFGEFSTDLGHFFGMVTTTEDR